MSDINIAVVDSLKVLDPNRPIREADKLRGNRFVRFVPIVLQKSFCTASKKFCEPQARLSCKYVRDLIAAR